MDADNRNELFPVFLKAAELHILIAGGGKVALEKLHFLLKSSPRAQVRLVAPEILDEVRGLAMRHDQVTLLESEFRIWHLDGIDLVIAATDSAETNLSIRQAARGRGLLVNVADTPQHCDFYLGGIVTKGPLKIAISTNGTSPTFAKRFRQMLEESLPDSIPEMLANLHALRNRLTGDFDEKVRRLNEITADLAGKK